MLTAPLFSIIVTVYNLQAYLDRLLTSVVNQTYPKLQIIIIDDGSTDGSGALAEAWAKKDARIEVHHQENAGVSAARNAGLRYVQGTYLTLVDGDDWLEPNYAEFMMHRFATQPVQLVVCGFYLDPPGKSAATRVEAGLYNRRQYLYRLLRPAGSVRGYTWNKAYCTELIQRHQLRFDTDLNLMEDQVFNTDYARVSEQFYLDSTPYYHYYQRSDSLVNRFNLHKVRDMMVANQRTYQRMKKSYRQHHACD